MALLYKLYGNNLKRSLYSKGHITCLCVLRSLLLPSSPTEFSIVESLRSHAIPESTIDWESVSCEIFLVVDIGEFTLKSPLFAFWIGDGKSICFGNVRNILDLVAANDRSGVELRWWVCPWGWRPSILPTETSISSPDRPLSESAWDHSPER